MYLVSHIKNFLNKSLEVYEIVKTDSDENIVEIGLVHRDSRGKWFSDDSSFVNLRNEQANKRIKIVKKFIEMNKPKNVSFYLENNLIKINGHRL